MSQLKNLTALAGVCLGLALSAIAYAASSPEEALVERIKPVSEVCMVGSDCAAAPVAVAAGAPRTGEEVYKTKCFVCHATGASGSPKFGSAGDWAPRAAKGLDTLYTHALGGFNLMPAKGLCMDCSDDEVKGAVKYMVDNSK